MKEQHENLFTYLQNVTKTAIEEKNEHEKALLEDAWQKFKNFLRECAENRRTQATIHVAAYGGWEHIILKNLDEIVYRLKILGFSDKHIETNELHTYLTLNWED